MNKKKIIYIDEDARYGGPQHRMILAANNLKYKYNFLFLISHDDNIVFKKKLKKNLLKFKEIKITRLSKEIKTLIKYIIFFLPELFFLMNFLKKNRPDMVQVNSTPHFKALIASSLLGIPTVWVIEDCNLPKPIIFIFKVLYLILKPKIIVTSNSVKNYYLKDYRFNKNLRKIFAPISTKLYDYKIFKKKKFNKNKVNILMVSNLTKVKGIEVFLEIVKKSSSNLRFTLCGGYPKTQKKYAKNLIHQFKKFDRKKLNYIGYQNNIPKIISKCDFIICTSLSEAGPMTSIEAMCMKKPLITNDIGIAKDLLSHKKNAIIVKKNNPRSFLKSIDYLITRPDIRKKMINKAYKMILDKLSVDNVSREYENFYEYLMKKKK